MIAAAAAGRIHHVDHLDDRLNGNQAGNYSGYTSLTGADEPVSHQLVFIQTAGRKQHTGRGE